MASNFAMLVVGILLPAYYEGAQQDNAKELRRRSLQDWSDCSSGTKRCQSSKAGTSEKEMRISSIDVVAYSEQDDKSTSYPEQDVCKSNDKTESSPHCAIQLEPEAERGEDCLCIMPWWERLGVSTQDTHKVLRSHALTDIDEDEEGEEGEGKEGKAAVAGGALLDLGDCDDDGDEESEECQANNQACFEEVEEASDEGVVAELQLRSHALLDLGEFEEEDVDEEVEVGPGKMGCPEAVVMPARVCGSFNWWLPHTTMHAVLACLGASC